MEEKIIIEVLDDDVYKVINRITLFALITRILKDKIGYNEKSYYYCPNGKTIRIDVKKTRKGTIIFTALTPITQEEIDEMAKKITAMLDEVKTGEPKPAYK